MLLTRQGRGCSLQRLLLPLCHLARSLLLFPLVVTSEKLSQRLLRHLHAVDEHLQSALCFGRQVLGLLERVSTRDVCHRQRYLLWHRA